MLKVVWRMMYATDASIVSSSVERLAKIIPVIIGVRVLNEFGLIVECLEEKTWTSPRCAHRERT